MKAVVIGEVFNRNRDKLPSVTGSRARSSWANHTIILIFVIGCGGVGSGAVYWLSKRAGKRVLGLEQFNLGHHNGGSQDYSRIIRLAGYDDAMTPIAPDTYAA